MHFPFDLLARMGCHQFVFIRICAIYDTRNISEFYIKGAGSLRVKTLPSKKVFAALKKSKMAKTNPSQVKKAIYCIW